MEKNIGLALATFAMLDQRSINTVQKRKMWHWLIKFMSMKNPWSVYIQIDISSLLIFDEFLKIRLQWLSQKVNMIPNK